MATAPSGTDLVEAARSGDARAQADLFSEYLPLVYNVVGRGLRGHADVDDVVQETMLRAMRGLPRLREPERFRSWIVAIAIRQMHDHGRRSSATLARRQSLGDVTDIPDPSGDIAERTADRQSLARAGVDLAEASLWLSDDERRTLALWWQETAGELTRAEVAAALDLSVAHTAVRIQRMKAKLAVALGVLAAWRSRPRCPELVSLASGTTGLPTRLSRHVAQCVRCQRARAWGSVDDLPIRLGALPVPAALAAGVGSLLTRHAVTGGLMSTLRQVLRHGLGRVSAKAAAIGGATIALTTVAGLAVYQTPLIHPHNDPPAPAVSVPQPSSQTTGAGIPQAAAYSGLATADYYVATDGNDANPGTITQPFATLTRADSAAKPGQSVAVRAGTYRPGTEITLNSSGTADHRITVSNYRDEHPVLDGSRIPPGATFIAQNGSYVTVQGIEIVNTPDHPYICESCHNDVFTRLSVHDNGQIGLLLHGAGTHDDLVSDSDFSNNHEPGSTGGYADGLGLKDGSGSGNRIQGCRIYDNSGDGVDLTGFGSAVTIDHTWSFGNGVNRWGTAHFSSGGSGFKLGGDTAVKTASIVTDSAAWDNAGFGFTETGAAGTPRLTNDTAFRNSAAGFAFVSSAADLSKDLALANHPDAWLGGRAQHTGNSWDQAGWTTAVLNLTGGPAVTARRGLDGRLPSTLFLSNTKNPVIGASMTP